MVLDRLRLGPGLAAVLLSCCLAQMAAAQQPSQSQVNAIRQNCRSDYQSYCSSVPPGGQASLQCLQQNMSRLSPGCGQAVGAVSGASQPNAASTSRQGAPAAQGAPGMQPRQEAALMRRSCGADYRAYCRGVPLGGGNAMRCLAGNQSRLSSSCKGALAELRAGR